MALRFGSLNYLQAVRILEPPSFDFAQKPGGLLAVTMRLIEAATFVV